MVSNHLGPLYLSGREDREGLGDLVDRVLHLAGLERHMPAQAVAEEVLSCRSRRGCSCGQATHEDPAAGRG